MYSQDDDDNQAVVWAVLIAAVLLAVSLAVGVGLYRTGSARASAQPSAPASETITAVAGSVPVTVLSADGSGIRVEEGVVKFFFASGSATLASGAPEALADVVKGVATGKTAIISGFHDTTGNAAQNAELAKQRALAVRDALMALGVGEDRLTLKKPEVSAGDGSNAEARRVEVTLE